MADPIPIPQAHRQQQIDPYVVAGHLPQAAPLIGCFSVSDAFVGTASEDTAIDSQLSIDLGSTSRWIADPLTMHDNGDGTIDWQPSQGSLLTSEWRFLAANEAVIDTGYDYKLRNKSTLAYPAMIFEGDMWAKLHDFPDPLAACTFIAVLRMHGTNGGSYAGIVESYMSGSDPDASADVQLRLRGSSLGFGVHGVATNGWDLDTPDRPLIVAVAHHTKAVQIVVQERWSTAIWMPHAAIPAYDMSWFLGRSGAAYDANKTMLMDVLDISMWDSALSLRQIRAKVNALNSIYAVTR